MLIYIASPYSHEDKDIMSQRYFEAMRYNNFLFNNSRHAYSPIVHTHNLALVHNLRTDAKFWRSFNFKMLSVCTDLHILQLDGWSASKGVEQELDFAHLMGKRIQFAYWDQPAATYRTIDF